MEHLPAHPVTLTVFQVVKGVSSCFVVVLELVLLIATVRCLTRDMKPAQPLQEISGQLTCISYHGLDVSLGTKYAIF